MGGCYRRNAILKMRQIVAPWYLQCFMQTAYAVKSLFTNDANAFHGYQVAILLDFKPLDFKRFKTTIKVNA